MAPCTSSSWAVAGWAPSWPCTLEKDGHTRGRHRQGPQRLPPPAPGLRGQGRPRASGSTGTTSSRPGSRRPGALAAVTNGDNSNILTARIARETYEIPNVVARIYDPRRAVIYQRLGIPTVATVAWTTDQVLRRLLPDEVGDRVDRRHRQASAWSSGPCPTPGPGRKLAELDEPDRFRLVAVDPRRRGPAVAARRSSARRATSCTSRSGTDALDELRGQRSTAGRGGH